MFIETGEIALQFRPLTISTWGTSTRPSSPRLGLIGFNLDTNYLEIYDGSSWITCLSISSNYQIASIWHAYGGFQSQSETIEATKDTWAMVTNATNNLFTGEEGDGLTLSGDIITVTNAGDYFGHVSLTISGTQGDDWFMRVYNVTQATQMGYRIGVTTTGANNYQTLSLPLYLECNANDQLRLEVMNITNNNDCVVRDCVFYISYLHD